MLEPHTNIQHTWDSPSSRFARLETRGRDMHGSYPGSVTTPESCRRVPLDNDVTGKLM